MAIFSGFRVCPTLTSRHGNFYCIIYLRASVPPNINRNGRQKHKFPEINCALSVTEKLISLRRMKEKGARETVKV